MSNNYCIIMAGGIGSRFWPMSRQNHPKQFIDVLGCGETLLQATYRRVKDTFVDENIFIVTNEDYTHLVEKQLPTIPKGNILSEPLRKNTAPCIAYAAFKIKQKNEHAIMFITPADHLISKEKEFTRLVNLGIEYASKNDELYTMGIKPTRPDTGYGYIQFNGSSDHAEIRKVKTFTEKPELELAKHFLSTGEFMWNSGMFIWSVKSFMNSLKEFMNSEYNLFSEIEQDLNTEKEAEVIADVYRDVKNISIDNGIMEKAKNVKVILADLGWSDLGTWGSLYEELKSEKKPNAVVGKNVMTFDSKNNIVHVPKDKLVVIQGLEGYIVAENNGTLLICKMEDEQKIKAIVNDVKIEKGEKFL